MLRRQGGAKAAGDEAGDEEKLAAGSHGWIVVENFIPRKGVRSPKKRFFGNHLPEVKGTHFEPGSNIALTCLSAKIGSGSGAYTKTVRLMTPADRRRNR